jgi:tRNA-modifying protein YgfZ
MRRDLDPINFSTSGAIFGWRPAGWLRVSGPDAFPFLQGQFSNDLRDLTGKPAVYGLWLSLKGKILADSFVLRGREPDEFWLGSYGSPGNVICERLESHIIADEVVVEDATAEWAGITVFGNCRRPGIDGSSVALVFPGRRIRGEHEEWMFRLDDRARVEAGLGERAELDRDAMEWLRIAAGIPAIPVDVGPADLPGEAGLEDDAISFTKGCYLGQEVMARLKSMGRVRRRLLRVRGPAADAPRTLPAPLFSGGRQVGDLRSVARQADEFVGFAMLALMHISGETKLALTAVAPPTISLVDLP